MGYGLVGEATLVQPGALDRGGRTLSPTEPSAK
jgi:hypothetical protein